MRWQATRADLGQLLWAVLLLELFAAGLVVLGREWLGWRDAIMIGAGVGLFVLVVFGCLVAGSVAVSLGAEWLRRKRHDRAV